ncbi:rhomboid-5 isoform X3 [Osmia lignaria lignaria]|uniref:rhomboid-5 isoform X3 n=1 Tax=Osmia lignaria lignaria TaxID=1437193 RepID=UPI00402BBECA
MPTDDDYGRRERLLLHQHPISQFGPSSSPVPGSNAGTSGSVGPQIGSNGTSDCYKQQQQQQQQQQQTDLRSANTSNASGQDRYQSEQPNQGNEHVDYGGRERMSGIERQDKSTDKPSIEDFPKSCPDARSIQSGCERFGHYQNQERYVQSSLQTQHQFTPGRSSSSSGQTLSQNVLGERFPRFNELAGLHGEQRLSLAPSERYQQANGSGNELRFHHPGNELVSSTGNEYANSQILVSGCATSPFSSETFPSPPSPAPANDRFVPPPPLSPSPSEKYASTQSLAGYSPADRILPPSSPSARYGGGTAPASPMPAKERFSSAERLLANQQSSSGVHESKDQQRYTGSNDRLLSGSSPVLGSLQGDRGNVYAANKDSTGSRYSAISTDRLLSASPVHAPVPERFAGKSTDRYIGDSPVHERYHRQETASSVHHERYTTMSSSNDRFIASSPNPEGAHQRYSSTERSLQASSNATNEQRRLYTDRGVETVCQKYTDRSNGSPVPTEFSRYSSFQEVGAGPAGRYVSTGDRFNELAIQRCGQSRANDRFCVSTDRYLANSSPGHDGRLANTSDSRYTVSASSTERLLSATSSSSSSSSDTLARYHSSYTNTTAAAQSSTSNDRFTSISPTPETANAALRGGTGTATGTGGSSYQPAAKTSVDKYLQVSKSIQSYGNDRYNPVSNPGDQFDRLSQDRYDRFSNAVGNSDRFTASNATPDRFHSAADRYSPARTADKYLSLPKPKDRYTSRITPISSSCGTSVVATSTDRTYGSSNATGSYVPPTAHTPVERYVPQPPPEVLYPDRYVDRYVPPSAHTPTDRYVPTNDPGDPYMRRDLGFHHHYRLPPPAGYPYHQSHFRLRGFAYASPGRLGGSPGSSSSSSSASNQRDGFSMSPLLRPKVRASAVEFSATSTGVVGRHVCTNPPSCCSEATGGNGRSCCQAIRRSLPPGPLPSIPTQSSWQPSPGSGTTGTSTVSSSGPDAENGQSIGLYPVGSVGPTPTDPTTVPPNTTTTTIPLASACTVVGAATGSNITRSVSAPTAPRPVVQVTSSASAVGSSQKPRLRRTMSRTEAIRNYIRRETAQFFGVDEESEAIERQRWLDRRRRMASRKYGALVPEHRPPDPDITRDVPDTTDIPEGVTLRRWQQPVRRKDSVARMTLSGLHYVVESLSRQRSREMSQTRPESRSFPPSVIPYMTRTETASSPENNQEEEVSFFDRPPPPPPPLPPPASQQSQSQIDPSIGALVKDEEGSAKIADQLDSTAERETSEELVRFAPQKAERTAIDGQIRRHRHIPRDHYISRKTSWSRSRYDSPLAEGTRVQQDEGVSLRRDLTGGTRISPSTIDRIFDNSNRRQYGMGIVGRFLGSFRKSVSQNPDVRKQLDDFEDNRPYFTYWITTVQILILIISLACYGFGPVGMDLSHRSGLVLVTSLSLQQVDYQEPANFWFGPRAADLIHLGAKFAPCMRRDIKILKEIDVWRERERDTACCIRNDDSGCVQSSKADCSVRGLRSTATNTISTWKKWGPGDSGPGGRISGSVCGLDPKFCDAPASIAPYEWPDDITKWPICRKTNSFNQRFSRNGSQRGNVNFPVGRYKDKMAEHMVCEVIGHPCCIGIHGMCRITTKEYCDFVHGYFHEEASLCSQVECLHDVCGMIPFLHPEWPDQFYRLFTTTFLHAGILHLCITLLVQYFLMRDLEKLTGSFRIALIYFIGALAGNLASAIFVPYRAEVGPAGAHFALLATLIVEVLHCWPMLKHPRRALSKLIFTLFALLILGILPWVDNYAHLFGFIFGFLAAYALMPFISFGHYDRRRKIWLIWICLILIVVLFALLLTLFYNVPVYECEVCKLFNCIPFTRDFCASQNINFKREEPV